MMPIDDQWLRRQSLTAASILLVTAKPDPSLYEAWSMYKTCRFALDTLNPPSWHIVGVMSGPGLPGPAEYREDASYADLLTYWLVMPFHERQVRALTNFVKQPVQDDVSTVTRSSYHLTVQEAPAVDISSDEFLQQGRNRSRELNFSYL